MGGVKTLCWVWEVRLSESHMYNMLQSAPYKQPIRGHYRGVSTQTNTGIMPGIKFKLGGRRLTINPVWLLSPHAYAINQTQPGLKRLEGWSNIVLTNQSTGCQPQVGFVLWNIMTLTSRDYVWFYLLWQLKWISVWFWQNQELEKRFRAK